MDRTFQCPKCCQSTPISLHPNGPTNYCNGLYHGRCQNECCSNAKIPFWVCLPCLNHQVAHTGGEKGYIPQWKALNRHAQSKFHRNAMQKWLDTTNIPGSHCPSHGNNTIFQGEDEEYEMGDTEEAQNGCFDPLNGRDSAPNQDTPLLSSLSEDTLRSMGFADGSKSPSFIWQNMRANGHGLKYLTSKAFGLQPDEVTWEEAQFSVLMSSLLIELSGNQRRLLANILLLAGNAPNPSLSIFKQTRLPTSVEDFDRFYLKGKNSFMQNLPIPVVRKTPDGLHSYVSLVDLVANEFGKAQEFDDLKISARIVLDDYDRVPNVAATPHGRKVLLELQESPSQDSQQDQCELHLWLREWRDDFDPNNTKSSRNQVWVNTFTLGSCDSNQNSGATTYFMGLGAKGDDHSSVEKALLDEMQKFNAAGHKLFHGGLKRIVHVKLGKLVTGIDRPERTSMFGVGDHNGTYSVCWGVATKVDELQKENKLPACSKCRRKRLNHLGIMKQGQDSNNNQGCISDCQNWNLFEPGFKFATPKNYPTIYDKSSGAPRPPNLRPIFSKEDTSDKRNHPTQHGNTRVIKQDGKRQRKDTSVDPQNYLTSVELSIPWLKQAVIFAHHNVRTTNPKQGRSSRSYWTKGNLSAYLRTCGCTNKLIDQVYLSAKNGDQVPIFPESWRDSSGMQRCHYAPMHMVFLGTMKTVLELIFAWMSRHESLATMGKQLNKYLTDIKLLRCSRFFAAQPLSTSSWGTGTWVSENYLFSARFLKFLLTLPCFSNHRMLRREGIQKELKVVRRFIDSLTVAISLLMLNQKTIANLQQVVEVYLDCLYDMENIEYVASQDDSSLDDTSSTNKKMNNIMKSNSLGLLAVTRFHNEMGPATLHWEGGFAGERKIQQVKPALSIKRATVDWTKLTLMRMYQHDALHYLQDLADLPTKSGRNRLMDGIIKVYSREDYGPDKLEIQRRPISCIIGKDGLSVHIVVWDRTTLQLRKVIFDDRQGTMVACMCWVAPVKLAPVSVIYDSMDDLLNSSDYREAGLLLPIMEEESREYKNQFFSIGSSWSQRLETGDYSIPQLQGRLYGDWL